MKGILEVTDEELVSIDFRGNPALVDRGRAAHQGRGRQPGQGLLLVRQRVGLLEPHEGPAPLHGQARPRRLSGVADGRRRRSEDLRDLEGARVVRARGLQRPARGRRASPTTRASARPCPPSSTCARPARGWCWPRTWAVPRRGPTPELSLKPVAARLAELLGAPVDDGARLRRAARCSDWRPALGRRRRAAARERALPQGGGGERRRLRRAARSRTRGATVFVNDAFGTRPPRPRLDGGRVAPRARRRVAGLLMEKELRYLGHGPRGAGAAVRGRAGRGQGLGQDRGHREPAAARGRAADRRRHGLHVPPRPGAARPARAWSRRTRSTLAAALLAQARRQDPPARGPRGGRRLQGGRRAQDAARRARSPRAGWASTSAPRPRGAYAEEAGRREARALERAHGRVRDGAVREGTLAMAQRAGRQPGRSIVGGGDSVAAVTQMGLADRIDHVSTGGGASLEFLSGEPLPGVACLRGRVMRTAAASPATGRCTRRSRRRVALAREVVREGATGDVEVVVAPPVHRARTRWPRSLQRQRRCGLGGQNMHLEAEGAFTGEVSPRDAAATSGCTPRHPRPLRAPPALRRDRRGRGAARRRPPSRHGLTPDRVRGRDAGRARVEPDHGGGGAPGGARAARADRRPGGGRAWWPTSRCGPSAPAAPPRPSRRRRSTPSSAGRVARSHGEAAGGRRCASSTAAA